MTSKVLSVVGWKQYQHYKDRDPPWVKLYKNLLTSEPWVLGSDTSRLVQVASILLAARYDNKIPLAWEFIHRVSHLGCGEAEFLSAVNYLVHAKFLEIHEVDGDALGSYQGASNTLSTCATTNHGLYSETETETETEGETDTRASVCKQNASSAIAPGLHGAANTQRGDNPTPDISGLLERLQDAYPAGTYRADQWLIGHREALTRVSEGATVDELVAGCHRYRAQCEAKRAVGTQYVMSPAKFFTPICAGGPAPYQDEFPIPRSRGEVHQASNVEAGREWLQASGDGS